MKKIFFVLSVLALWGCLMLIFSSPAAAKVYVDIDSPAFKMIPVAICDFNDPAVNAPSPAGYGMQVAEGVRNDLTLTGLFNLLNKKSFLEDKSSVTAMTADKIRFPDWTAIGADYLLRGNIMQSGPEVTADCYFFDVTRGELIFNKKYRAEAGKVKEISRTIATDILKALINDEGDFKTQIAFVSKNRLKSDIHAVSYDGSEARKITSHQSILMTPRWSPDGHFLAFTSFKRGRPEIYLRNLQNGEEKRIAAFEGLNLCGTFSPDGGKLLLTLSKDGNEEIYVLDLDNLKLRRLTRNFSIDVSPAWSPDGKKIVFVSNRSGSPQIYIMDADGNNPRRITYEGSYNTSPSWSPRGDRIVYEGLKNDRYQIFSIDEEGSHPLQLTSDAADNESPSWSPSGRQIVYVSQKNAKSKIIIMNSNGSSPRLLHEQNNKMVMTVWSPRLK